MSRALLVALGCSGGLLVGLGAAGLLSALGMPGRFAVWAGDKRLWRVMAYTALAAICSGACAYTFALSVRLPRCVLGAFGLAAGLFVGVLACALVEMLDALPVLLGTRVTPAVKLGLAAMALGKTAFGLWDLLKPH